MDKLWIIPLFLVIFLALNNTVKSLIIKRIASKEKEEPSASSVGFEEKEDPRVFFREEGLRREPENAEYDLPEKDFFENEETEFFEHFEEEFSGLSEDDAEKILFEAGLFEKEGEAL